MQTRRTTAVAGRSLAMSVAAAAGMRRAVTLSAACLPHSSAAVRLLSTAAAATPSSSSSSPSPSSPNGPRVAVLGAGISGLVLAQQLQRSLRLAGRSDVQIQIIEQSKRAGGWLRTDRLSAPEFGEEELILERGPRSFIHRGEGDAGSERTLELIRSLQLGSELRMADPALRKRFLWNASVGVGPSSRVHPCRLSVPSGLGSSNFVPLASPFADPARGWLMSGALPAALQMIAAMRACGIGVRVASASTRRG